MSSTELRCVWAWLLLCVFFAPGCRQRDDSADSEQSTEPQTTAASEAPSDSVEAVVFADRKWTLSGPCQTTGDIFRPSMSAVYYTTNENDIRLIELVANESGPLKEGVFSRIRGVQGNQNGRWISHGPREEIDLDGSRGEMQYVYGKLHGTQRHWYPNGQLHIEREWADDKMHGRDRGWYSNGKPQYDSQNVNGEEVSGESWDENGRPY